ncbi:MAG: hypothetical protein KC505_06745, partial [Myxococcales bacterium]|nr:hypothetical protein [Myxococcales bacterium]
DAFYHRISMPKIFYLCAFITSSCSYLFSLHAEQRQDISIELSLIENEARNLVLAYTDILHKQYKNSPLVTKMQAQEIYAKCSGGIAEFINQCFMDSHVLRENKSALSTQEQSALNDALEQISKPETLGGHIEERMCLVNCINQIETIIGDNNQSFFLIMKIIYQLN